MITFHTGDVLKCLAKLPDASVQTVVTSPPYWGLRDYGVDGQLGLEKTPAEFVAKMVRVFAEVHRVLRDDGTCWVNLGDSYAGGGGFSPGSPSNQPEAIKHRDAPSTASNGVLLKGCKRPPGLKPKDLVGIPWRVAFALQDAGWYLRSDIIWHKPNPMPESVRDRPTKAHEYVFLLTKRPRYFYDAEAVREAGEGYGRGTGPGGFRSARYQNQRSFENSASVASNGTHGHSFAGGRNARSVWTITPKPFKGAHFATFPPALVERCVKAGSRPGDLVLDPFAGAGTVGLVAKQLGRSFVGIDLNPEYVAMARQRIEAA